MSVSDINHTIRWPPCALKNSAAGTDTLSCGVAVMTIFDDPTRPWRGGFDPYEFRVQTLNTRGAGNIALTIPRSHALHVALALIDLADVGPLTRAAIRALVAQEEKEAA